MPLFPSVLSQVRQKPSLGQTPNKPEHWTQSPFFCFHPEEGTRAWEFLPSCTVLCQVEGGVRAQNTTSFQWSHFLVMHWPGYCCFSSGLYSFHKDVLVHILLLIWCLRGGTKAWRFLVYHLGDVSQIILS